MRCTNCEADNAPDRKFCLNCGQRLALACPSCGSPNTPGAKFCGECGNPLGGAEPAAPPPIGSPATERRLVSVLFADLVGFTGISEARDAEDVRALLDRYFETCRDVIDRYGGTVEKFIGDAVMAVWGTPLAREDDAERAVRAALDLVDAVRQLGTERQVAELALRAAVHTGEAVVTIGAAGMGMVAGDLVNTASRLQSVAHPGTVLVGEGTRRAAGTAIVFADAGEQTLKGKALPIPAFRAVRVVAQVGGVGRDQLEAPFVGRDSELRLIKDFYHATARDRGPRLVSVIGQAGIGKSRLAWEFLKYIDGVREIVYWHQGRSPAYGDGISFWALGEMVRMRIGTSEADDEEETRARLAATLEEFVADAEERRGLSDPLLQLLGMGDGTTRERGQLFTAWRTFFERIAEHGPVIMVFEDLQWADDGLLDFIEEMVSWSRGRSIYLVTLSRAELLDRRPTWGAGQRNFTSLSIAPLAEEDMRALLDGLVPGLPESIVAQIIERAEGIPLFAVETVRTLLNDGRIERDGDEFRPVGDLTELAVPESLHGLIAARIDALPPAERTLVQDGSVLGLSFGLPALQAVARAEPDGLGPMLQHLVQREVLTIDDDPRSPERGSYRFVQGLLREVAYGTLSRDDRRARHLAAARHYEALGDDELAGVLAQHYVDAYHAHPDGAEGAAVAAQARVALRGAAQRAADLGSHRRAHSYLESALVVTGDPTDELELRVAAHQAAANGGMFDVAVAHGERAMELADSLGDKLARRLAAASLGNILLEGQQDRAMRVLEGALAEPGLTPDDDGYVQIATVLAKAEMRRQNEERGLELAEQALPLAARAADDELIVDLVVTRAVCQANLGRALEAVVALTGAVEIARRRSMGDAANRAAVNLGYVLAPDDPVAAFDVSRDMLEESLREGVIQNIRYMLGNAIDAAIEIGKWDWAEERMQEHEFLFVEPAEQLWFGHYAAVIGAYRGQDVAEIMRNLHEQSRAFDDAQFRVLGATGHIIDLVLRGETTAAIGVVDQLLELGNVALETPIWAARSAAWDGDAATVRRMREAASNLQPGRRTTAVLAGMDGAIHALEGRAPEARASFADAQRLMRAMGVELILGLTDIDVIVTGAMERDERERTAQEAREIFTRLGAAALLARLDAALERASEGAGHTPASPVEPGVETSRTRS